MHPPISEEKIKQIVTLYQCDYTLRGVANRVGLHVETVRKYLKKCGVPIKPPHLNYSTRQA